MSSSKLWLLTAGKVMFRLNQKGYVMAIAILALAIFSLTSLALFNSYLHDTKHQIMVVQFDENYFLAEGAKERFEHYLMHELAAPAGAAPYQYGDSVVYPSMTVTFDSLTMTVSVNDAYLDQ